MRKLTDLAMGTAAVLALALAAPTGLAAQEAPEVPEITVEVAPVNGTEGHAMVRFEAVEAGVTGISMEVHGAEQALSGFIFAGTCEAPGELRAPLGSVEVVDGMGTSAVLANVDFAELTAGPAIVQLHPAGDGPTEALFCGALNGAPEDL
jgi:hypothetical protein